MQLLPVPELVPFRLTQQLLSVLYPLTDERGRGLVQRLMARLVHTLRPHAHLLADMLTVFLLDPALDWSVCLPSLVSPNIIHGIHFTSCLVRWPSLARQNPPSIK